MAGCQMCRMQSVGECTKYSVLAFPSSHLHPSNNEVPFERLCSHFPIVHQINQCHGIWHVMVALGGLVL